MSAECQRLLESIEAMSVALDNAQDAGISSSIYGLHFHSSTTDLASCSVLQTESSV